MGKELNFEDFTSDNEDPKAKSMKDLRWDDEEPVNTKKPCILCNEDYFTAADSTPGFCPRCKSRLLNLIT